MNKIPRRWEWTPFSKEYSRNKKKFSTAGRKAVEFSIMTYNILSQDALQNHMRLYSGGKGRALEWKDRRRRIIAEIAQHDPDVSWGLLSVTEIAQHDVGWGLVLVAEIAQHDPDVSWGLLLVAEIAQHDVSWGLVLVAEIAKHDPDLEIKSPGRSVGRGMKWWQ